MNLEDISEILFWGGALLLYFSIGNVYAKQKREIAENFPEVYKQLCLTFKQINIYEVSAYSDNQVLSDYHELQGMVSKFDECMKNDLLPSPREWYHAKELMKKYRF